MGLFDFELPNDIKSLAGFDDQRRLNKVMRYFIEIDVEVDDLDDMDRLVNVELSTFSARVMSTPEDFSGPFDITIRVDFEDISEIEGFADFLFDNDYIDEESYLDFEDMVDEY